MKRCLCKPCIANNRLDLCSWGNRQSRSDKFPTESSTFADRLTDHLANRLRLMIGFNNSLETVLEQKVKAIIYIEKGLNCEIFPGDKFTLGVTSQLQIECSVLDKIFRR